MDNQQNQTPAEGASLPPKATKPSCIAKMDGKRIASLAFLTISFLSVLFFNWYKVDMLGGFGPFAGLKVSLFGYTQKIGLGDISGFLVIAQILAIINIFAFLSALAINTISFDILPLSTKKIPALKNVERLSIAIYYLVLLVALLFGLIGAISEDMGLGAGWWITFLVSSPGIALTIKPDLIDKLGEIAKGEATETQD